MKGLLFMDELKELFQINITKDLMLAELHCLNTKAVDLKIEKDLFLKFLRSFKIEEGVNSESVDKVLAMKNTLEVEFPLVIAEGIPPENGIDGNLELKMNIDTKRLENDEIDFREVMRIPTVKKGEKLATIVLPTDGVDGIDVRGEVVKAIPGKPVANKPGKNVVYNESDLSFYAATDGQINIGSRLISVQDIYELREAISMKTGNLDFVGSIVIHGDVPSGFTVKAEGDIRIFGIVEAATIISNGSIYISEGINGLEKGSVIAKENIHVGYINQGNVHAGESLHVDNSILHSECSAKKDVMCKLGNIIGGTVSAGNRIVSLDIGNRLNTETNLMFGLDKSIYEEEQKLIVQKKDLKETLHKLQALSDKINSNPELKNNPKHRITMLRQKNSYNKTKKTLDAVNDSLHSINAVLGDENNATLKVKGTIYPNSVVTFGKYKQVVREDRQHVEMFMEQNEITMKGL